MTRRGRKAAVGAALVESRKQAEAIAAGLRLRYGGSVIDPARLEILHTICFKLLNCEPGRVVELDAEARPVLLILLVEILRLETEASGRREAAAMEALAAFCLAAAPRKKGR